jgi:hypothetical protein
LFPHLTPRQLARAPFRVAVLVAASLVILGAGGLMAMPKSPEPMPVFASTPSPAPAAIAPPAPAPITAPAVPTVKHLAAAKPSDVTCLAKAVYYEARGESAEGQAAVAQVVINRTHRRSYPSNVCGVVFQGERQGGCQFSFVCNGAMRQPLEQAAWWRARRVATYALSGHVMRAVGQAVSFHVGSGDGRYGEVAHIGAHVFFVAGGDRAAHRAPIVQQVAEVSRTVEDHSVDASAMATASAAE